MIRARTLETVYIYIYIYINICIKKLNRKIKLGIEYKKAYIIYAFLCYSKMFS